MSTFTPPEESTSHVHHHDDSPSTQAGATHTVLSFLEQATSQEGRPDSTPASTVIGAAHNMLHRFSSPPSSTHHAHVTQSPESRLDAAAAPAAPTVLGAAQHMFSKLTHATSHATPVPQIQQPIPEVPREQVGEASLPTEGPQQLSADITAQGHIPRSVSSRGGGNGEGRAITPPRGVARITRSYPAPLEAMHLPRPIRLSHSHRRPTGTYANSEAEWDSVDDKDLVRLFPGDTFTAVMSG